MATATKTPVKTWGFYLDGKWLSDGERFEVLAPYDHAVVGSSYRATATHAEEPVRAAQRAFQITRKMPGYERQAILRAISAGIPTRREEFARLIAQEAGKPIRTARAEVDRAIFSFAVAAEEATRIGGEWLPPGWQGSTAGPAGIVRRFALGPILAITPFNFPLNLVAHKVAPAIAAGCSMVLKPAPQTPLTSLLLAEVIQQAGWPDGGFNAILLSNEDSGLLVSDERIKLISFTGSAAVGWAITKNAGKKKVVLELGGNSAVIVHSDTDLAYAAERCVNGGFAYAGQSCISVQRILVEHSVYGKFTELLLAAAGKLKVGDPLKESSDLGPLVRESDAIRAAEWVQEAVRGGARLLCGGSHKGSLFEPTILTGTKPNMKVNCQEIFAPVVTVEPYTDFATALKQVNSSAYGLQAGLFTRDPKLIFQAYPELEVGGLIAGDVPTFRVDHMPYGGVKDSGLGREGLRDAIHEMTEPKLLVMNLR